MYEPYDTLPMTNSAPGQPLPPTPTTQGQNPAPLVYYATPAITYNFVQHYNRKTSTGLGATQIVLAFISITAGVIAFQYNAECDEIGVGIWAGVWYLIAGSLAVAAGKKPTNNLITATLVFSVFDILFGATQLTIATVGVINDLNHLYCDGGYPPFDTATCLDWWERVIAANSMMIGVGSLEIIFGLWMTVVSGHAIDKGSKPQFANIQITIAPNLQEPAFTQGSPSLPDLQSQPPTYYERLQHPSTSNQQQTMSVGVHQAPLTTIKL